MPVIVVGADTPLGRRIVDALLVDAVELRAFVSDAAAAAELKRRGVKVAIGDVSDGSHVGGAALNTFSAVLLTEAAVDGRERSFATTPEDVVAGWADGIAGAGTRRVIWVDDGSIDAAASAPIAGIVEEFALVEATGRSQDDVVAEVVRLEGVDSI